MTQIERIISEIFGIDEDRINGDLRRNVDPEWDSFNHLLLISQLESELGITFTMAEVESITCYEELLGAIGKRGIQ